MATFEDIREASADPNSQILVGTVSAVSPLTVDFGNVSETTNTVLVAIAGYDPEVNDEVVCWRAGNFYVVIDKLGDDNGWVSFTPTVDNGLTVGNGTWTGSAYKVLGKLCWVRYVFNWGSTSSISGGVRFETPFTMANQNDAVHFSSRFIDATSSDFQGSVIPNSTTAIQCVITNVAGTYPQFANISNTVPFTWASGDLLLVGGVFEVA